VVDGGATATNFLCSFKAIFLIQKVIRPKITETTALGAAYLAGLAVGFWKTRKSIQSQWQVDRIFESAINDEERPEAASNWKESNRCYKSSGR
jgi:glycerol kinase